MTSSARTIIVNEAFARAYSRETGSGSPVGARLRFAMPSGDDDDAAAVRPQAWEPWGEIVGVVRDFGLDPDDNGNEQPHVFHAASAGALPSLVMSVRIRGNPATLAARLPLIAATVDAQLLVQDSQPMEAWVRQRNEHLMVMVGAQVAVTVLVLFLSALGIFSLVSISVSRRTREIGLRAALGASPRQVLSRHPVPRRGAHGEWHRRRRRPSVVDARPRRGTLRPARGRRSDLRRVSRLDLRGHARRVSVGLHRARSPRAQDQSHRGPEGGLKGVRRWPDEFSGRTVRSEFCRRFTSRFPAARQLIGRCPAAWSRHTPMREWLRTHRSA